MRTAVYPDDVWADAVAHGWIERLSLNPHLVMCLPTGSTPRPVYELMQAAVDGGAVTFRHATVFLLDEFGDLPAGDPGRCDAMIQRHLIDGIDLPPEHLHAFDPAAPDIDAEVAAYRLDLIQAGLDLAIVGVGMNGHVGLNEPGSTPDSPARRVELAPSTQEAMLRYGGAQPAKWGVTLGLADIFNAREIWMIITGSAKAEIARAVLEGPISADVPASQLRTHPNVVALLDESAAALYVPR